MSCYVSISNLKAFGPAAEDSLTSEGLKIFQLHYMGNWAGGHLIASNMAATI